MLGWKLMISNGREEGGGAGTRVSWSGDVASLVKVLVTVTYLVLNSWFN